jgi:hypothetical protein
MKAFIILLIASVIDATYDCTYKGVKYQCGQWSSDGFVCNNLMMTQGSCLVVMCRQFNSCTCRSQTWTCQMYEPAIMLNSDGTFNNTFA